MPAKPKRQDPSPKSSLHPLALEKLASSGLSPEVGQQLGMTSAIASDWDPQFKPLQALKIPYFTPDGKDSGFYRIRYLEQEQGFAGSVAKPQRYAQQKGTLNWVYLPTIKGLNWTTVAETPELPIIITEGELKAASACSRGFLTIALGGVSVWQSKKNEVPLLPPLDEFTWQGRQVTIIFDSDAASNTDVARAQLFLAEELLRLGANPKIATLPPTVTGGKQGLDDFIVAGGDLESVLAEARVLDIGRLLLQLNERYAYVKDQDVVITLESAHRVKRDGFINGLLANQRMIEYQASGDAVKRVEISVPKEWMKWACRRDVERVVYTPGEERITQGNEFNLWKGWGVAPSPGDISPWNELLDFLFNGSQEERMWFERWLAAPLQQPGTKCYSASVLWGPETGTGKSMIGYIMGRIYGDNFAEIGNAELHANFNEWAVGKQFILGDEITGSDRRNEADKLKQLITQQKLRINVKHLPTYEVPDCLNYYFTSNHPDAFFIDDKDRRYFIFRVLYARRERDFYQRIVKWYKSQAGAAALFDHLLRLDMGDFDPAAPAPESTAKSEMVDHGRSDVASFVSNLLRNTDAELDRLKDMLKLPQAPDLVLNTHLLHLYDPEGGKRVTANGLGRELARFGVKTVGPVGTQTFGKQRFYVLREAEKWASASVGELRDYVDTVFKNIAAKGGTKF